MDEFTLHVVYGLSSVRSLCGRWLVDALPMGILRRLLWMPTDADASLLPQNIFRSHCRKHSSPDHVDDDRGAK
jgi:hypothetical protein